MVMVKVRDCGRRFGLRIYSGLFSTNMQLSGVDCNCKTPKCGYLDREIEYSREDNSSEAKCSNFATKTMYSWGNEFASWVRSCVNVSVFS